MPASQSASQQQQQQQRLVQGVAGPTPSYGQPLSSVSCSTQQNRTKRKFEKIQKAKRRKKFLQRIAAALSLSLSIFLLFLSFSVTPSLCLSLTLGLPLLPPLHSHWPAPKHLEEQSTWREKSKTSIFFNPFAATAVAVAAAAAATSTEDSHFLRLYGRGVVQPPPHPAWRRLVQKKVQKIRRQTWIFLCNCRSSRSKPQTESDSACPSRIQSHLLFSPHSPFTTRTEFRAQSKARFAQCYNLWPFQTSTLRFVPGFSWFLGILLLLPCSIFSLLSLCISVLFNFFRVHLFIHVASVCFYWFFSHLGR